MFGIPYYLFWLFVMIALVMLEVSTMALTCIWFAVGALGAFLISFTKIGFLTQLAFFAVISGIALVFVKPIAAKRIYTNKTATNYDRLIGVTGMVTQAIDNELPTGQVTVKGQVWTARSKDDSVKIPQGSHVRINEISGVKLIVEKIEETKECSAV